MIPKLTHPELLACGPVGTSKKTPASKTATRRADRPLDYYLGCFTFDEFSDRDGEGSFQIIVQARGPEQAAAQCRASLERLRAQTTLFHRPCTIFLDGLLRLRGTFEEGLLVNYTSTISELPAQMPASIYCLVPEQEHPSESYDWSPEPRGKKRKKREEEDGVIRAPFVDFGGQSLQEERAARKRAETPPPPPPFDPAAERRDAEKKKADAAAAAKKAAEERQKALASTMKELQAEGQPRPRGRGRA